MLWFGGFWLTNIFTFRCFLLINKSRKNPGRINATSPFWRLREPCHLFWSWFGVRAPANRSGRRVWRRRNEAEKLEERARRGFGDTSAHSALVDGFIYVFLLVLIFEIIDSPPTSLLFVQTARARKAPFFMIICDWICRWCRCTWFSGARSHRLADWTQSPWITLPPRLVPIVPDRIEAPSTQTAMTEGNTNWSFGVWAASVDSDAPIRGGEEEEEEDLWRT